MSRHDPNEPDPGEYVGKAKAGREIGAGKVAQTGRWWSYDWWFGHWFDRTRCGEWREDGGPDVCHAGRRHSGEHQWKKAPASLLARRKPTGVRARTDAQRSATDYRAYLEARYSAAESATSGVMATRRHPSRPARRWFTGRPASLKDASPELREWFEIHGPNLTATQFRDQHLTRQSIHPYDD